MFALNFFVVLSVCLLSVVASNEKLVVCYYGSWATYRYGNGKFDVENINADLCTHLIYTFAGLNSDGTVAILDPYLDLPDNWGRNNFGKFNALKQANPKLKTLLAVGGWNEGSAKYSIMAANPTLRAVFAKSIVDLLLKYNFNGLDLDWEYPNRRDSINGIDDIDNFTTLLRELKAALDENNLSLSIAVSSVRDMASLSYDIPAISSYVEFINVMTYDLYGPWDPKTGHAASLHKGEGDENVPAEDLYTVDVALQYWIESGCPPEKLIVGLPFYGRTFILANANVDGVRAPAIGNGIAGPYTQTPGSIGYNEFCEKLKTESWDIRYDSSAKASYAVQGVNWISYDDIDSITAKIEYALSLNIGGAMIWSIETDDFHGLCNSEKYPLLKAINKALGRDVTQDEGSNESSTVTTTLSTSAPTEPSNVTDKCESDGFISDPNDCSKFYKCVQNEDGNFSVFEFQCPGNTFWDQSIHACNHASLVQCP